MSRLDLAILILNNEIAMLDNEAGRVAIFSAADHVLIQGNRIVVVPAPDQTDPTDGRDPDDPSKPFFDPCVDPRFYYGRMFQTYEMLKAVFLYIKKAAFFKARTYLAQGGIQIGGGSENVRIINNKIIGGYGSGITLGSDPFASPDIGHGSIVIDRTERAAAIGDEATLIVDRIDSADTVSMGEMKAVTYDRKKPYLDEVSEEVLTVLKSTFVSELYGISIEDNRIQNMGLSGIGVSVFMSVKNIGMMVGIEDLTIYRNVITRCAQQTPEEKPAAMKAEIGFGGVVLSSCENVIIQENRIEDNGLSQVQPVCGILILYGEKIEISNNRILNNGPRTFPEDVDAKSGLRGGVVIRMTFKQLAYKMLEDKALLSPDGIPAVKIHDNIITQPLGQALFIMALGPVSVIGNQLTSQGADFKVNPFSLLAGSVFILNLGISKDLMRAVFLSGFKYLASAKTNASSFGFTGTFVPESAAAGLATGDLLGVIQRILYLPSGNVLFANNQTTLDLRSLDMNFAFSSQLIASLDDVAYTSNQSECTSFIDFLYTNAAIFGVSIRSNDNRFQEGFTMALNSLFSYGFVNTAASNQATHCLQVYGAKKVYDPSDNIVIDPTGCAKWLKVVGRHLVDPEYKLQKMHEK